MLRPMSVRVISATNLFPSNLNPLQLMSNQPVIYKYPLTDRPLQQNKLRLPTKFKLLHVGLDPKGALCFWVEQDRFHSLFYSYQVFVISTGQPLFPECDHFLQTVQVQDEMWHVYVNKTEFVRA